MSLWRIDLLHSPHFISSFTVALFCHPIILNLLIATQTIVIIDSSSSSHHPRRCSNRRGVSLISLLTLHPSTSFFTSLNRMIRLILNIYFNPPMKHCVLLTNNNIPKAPNQSLFLPSTPTATVSSAHQHQIDTAFPRWPSASILMVILMKWITNIDFFGQPFIPRIASCVHDNGWLKWQTKVETISVIFQHVRPIEICLLFSFFRSSTQILLIHNSLVSK